MLIGLTLLTLGAVSRAQAQFPPSRYFGSATLNGQSAAGATVKAYINGVECGSTKVDNSGNYQFDVMTSSQRSGCGTPGVTINFTVNGANATQTAPWEFGGFIRVNLTASSSAPAPVTSSPTATVTAPSGSSNTGSTGATSTTQSFTPQWLDRPLATSAPQTKTCPSGNLWSFLYWGGPDGTPIGSAASACPSADSFWSYRNSRWLGYATQSVAASDSWSVHIGDANFIRGR